MMVMLALLLVSCGGEQQKVDGTPLSGEPQPGGLYSLNDGEGGFRVGKVIAVEDVGVFIHLYANRWTSRPTRQTAKSVEKPTAIAYSTQSFTSMHPLHLEDGTVSDEELSAYENWRRSRKPMF